jgi:uncharacterized protein
MKSEHDRQKHRFASRLFRAGRLEEAFQEYLELAEGGSVLAQTLLGWLYYKGLGVTQDCGKAKMWLERAAASGAAVALFYLGGFYRGQRKYRAAIDYLERAAEQDYPPALYHLSIMYDEGEGVAVDRDMAQQYLTKAAQLGNLRAQKEVAMGLIRGGGGAWRIPKGVLMFVCAIVTTARVGWKDPDSDRIRW